MFAAVTLAFLAGAAGAWTGWKGTPTRRPMAVTVFCDTCGMAWTEREDAPNPWRRTCPRCGEQVADDASEK